MNDFSPFPWTRTQRPGASLSQTKSGRVPASATSRWSVSVGRGSPSGTSLFCSAAIKAIHQVLRTSPGKLSEELWLCFEKLRQFGDIHRNPSRLIARDLKSIQKMVPTRFPQTVPGNRDLYVNRESTSDNKFHHI